MQFLFAALVFVIIALTLGGVLALTTQRKEGEIIRGRLEAIEKGGVFSKEPLNLDLIRDELLSSIPTFNRMLVRWSWPSKLRNFIAQAGMQVRAGKLIMVCFVIGFASLEAMQLFYHNVFLSFFVGIPLFFAPLVFVAVKRMRRMSSFQKQFPEVIDLLSRSVRAGHSFASGIEIVSTDLPEPVSGEFRMVFDEQRFGLPIRDALLGLCDRVPLIDVRLFVIALLVQKETGGNLVEILDKLAHVIRERFRIAGEIRIRTAQGRLTAGLLIALPLIMMAMLHFLDPAYVRVLFVERLGQLMLLGAGVMQIFGGIVIWRIVSIKV